MVLETGKYSDKFKYLRKKKKKKHTRPTLFLLLGNAEGIKVQSGVHVPTEAR